MFEKIVSNLKSNSFFYAFGFQPQPDRELVSSELQDLHTKSIDVTVGDKVLTLQEVVASDDSIYHALGITREYAAEMLIHSLVDASGDSYGFRKQTVLKLIKSEIMSYFEKGMLPSITSKGSTSSISTGASEDFLETSCAIAYVNDIILGKGKPKECVIDTLAYLMNKNLLIINPLGKILHAFSVPPSSIVDTGTIYLIQQEGTDQYLRGKEINKVKK